MKAFYEPNKIMFWSKNHLLLHLPCFATCSKWFKSYSSTAPVIIFSFFIFRQDLYIFYLKIFIWEQKDVIYQLSWALASKVDNAGICIPASFISLRYQTNKYQAVSA